MTYVIVEACIGVKDRACVDVCPVDCIHPTKHEPQFAAALQLYIDPDTCIDCGACVPECPVEAIFEEYDAPPGEEQQVELNRERAASGECPPILERRATAGRRS